MARPVRLQVKDIMKRINDSVTDAISPEEMRILARQAIDLITTRTRLGYGVRRNFGPRERLKPLSKRYIEFRRRYKKLSATTSPRTSNLTLTGQLLESIGIVKTSVGNTTIAAQGIRNERIVGYQQKQDRYFLRISDSEYKILLSTAQKAFGKSLRRNKLTR
jgi:hypothetical protein